MRASATGRGVNMVATIRNAAERGARIDGGRLEFIPDDLVGSTLRSKESNLIVFLVDASGSMAARDRLAAVTGAVTSLLGDAYQRRDKVAVISVRGTNPKIVLPPTGSIDIALKRLADVKTGGRTPLAEGLSLASELIERELRREPGRPAILVILSDGRATGPDGLQRLRTISEVIARRKAWANIVIDCEKPGRIQLGLARELAENIHGALIKVDELNADSVTGIIDAF
ncbi:VWA domain-containing protein [Corynebacterium sp. ES2794-CONJ1]|uniref:vWA domain-containing protein n=1 Tax=unclassified Corynebacterium TaxID=2624378 RepID=UPI002169188F|nr:MULTISPECIES: VWA domain-containing protein [unclassified Corynebacterium]MCS4490924.1 VWA domain-containing protein [Corynebacterium sp. ES2715-CONJ3]MCS4531194.1 VWA domain-containing protein [Corynebacterium sp. ES2730-CONJ]MCU9518562.1 VWA domain-containing protein [Corynebacterium sp. ES2794-CONJ1]